MKFMTSAAAAGTLIFLKCIFEKPVDPMLNRGAGLGITLSDRKAIERIDEPVTIYMEDTPTLGKRSSSPGKTVVENFEYAPLHIARVIPVNVGPDSVQACDIVIDGTTAVIAYNFAGDRFAGAIQIVDISKPSLPSIVTELHFEHCDINALFSVGTKVVFGGAADPDIFGYRSFVGHFSLDDIDPDVIAGSLRPMPSFAVTGIGGSGSRWFASCGALDGAVVWFDSELNPVDTIGVPDARDVAAYQAGICVIRGTTDNDAVTGAVLLYENDGSLRKELLLPDFGSDYHKATVEIINGTHAVLGLSEQGCKAISLQDGSITWEVANPPGNNSAGRTFTNSISADGNLLFTANGNYGFRIYRTNGSFMNVESVGFVSFNELKVNDEYYSANHIAFKGNILFVASGVGGVNIYTFTPK